jgi:ketosteroid isomerase-like protein
VGNAATIVGMSERSLRQTYQAIIAAVTAADKDALDHLIAEDIVVRARLSAARERSRRGRPSKASAAAKPSTS